MNIKTQFESFGNSTVNALSQVGTKIAKITHLTKNQINFICSIICAIPVALAPPLVNTAIMLSLGILYGSKRQLLSDRTWSVLYVAMGINSSIFAALSFRWAIKTHQVSFILWGISNTFFATTSFIAALVVNK